MLARFIPALAGNQQLNDIYNYLEIDGVYTTSGQPSAKQFQLIKEAGFQVVVNLAPTSMLENYVVEEKRILEELSIRYVHTPVDFKNPTGPDFQLAANSPVHINLTGFILPCIVGAFLVES